MLECYAFGKKLAVFRNAQNKVGALSARCCHIGADLSRGHVDHELLVCPLHHWSFDTNGTCQRIPCQTDIPARAKQQSLQCVEAHGIVYGYLGTEPDYTLPDFAETGPMVYSAVKTIDFDSAYEMATANSFDEQHLATVHRRKVLDKQKITSKAANHFAIEYRAAVTPYTVYDKILHAIGKTEVHMSLDCWGGNVMLFRHLGTPNNMIISLLPLSKNKSRAFIVTAIPRGNPAFYFAKKLQAQLLNFFTMLFVSQDVKVLQGIEFKFDQMLAVADATMIKWYKYWLKLPRETLK